MCPPSHSFVYTQILTFLFLSGGAAVSGGALARAAADCVRPQSTRAEGQNGED